MTDNGHALNVIDAVLHYVQGGTESSSPVYALRVTMRSRRPDAYLIWNEECAALLEGLQPATDEDGRLLDGVREILAHDERASTVMKELGYSQNIPFEEQLELKKFEAKPVIYAVWDKLMADLKTPDLTSKILRGHLWLEYSIEEVLRRRVASYEHFEKARLSFSAKIHLARSMSILQDDEYAVVMFINRIRNNLAHQFTYVVTPDVEAQLIQLASPDIRRTGRIKDTTEFPSGFEGIFMTLVVRLHMRVDHIEAHRRFDGWQDDQTTAIVEQLDGF